MKKSRLLEKNKPKHLSAVERYKKKRKQEIFIILFIIFIFASVAIFANSSYVKIKNVNVTGIKQLSKEDIVKTSGVTIDSKVWGIKTEEIKNIIRENFNIISDITVEKEGLNTINIDIKEKRLIAKEKKENNIYNVVLETGEIYNGTVINDFSLPILENFQENQSKKNEVIKNLVELKEEVLSNISEIVNDAESKELILIYMKDGQRIKAHSGNFSSKLNYYLEMSLHIDDKQNTILNLVNGSYLETKKSLATKDNKIRQILEKSNSNSSEKKKDTIKNSKKTSKDSDKKDDDKIKKSNNTSSDEELNKEKQTTKTNE